MAFILNYSGVSHLAVSLVKLTVIANWAFLVSPQTWNDLPEDVTSTESLFIIFTIFYYVLYSTAPNLTLWLT